MLNNKSFTKHKIRVGEGQDLSKEEVGVEQEPEGRSERGWKEKRGVCANIVSKSRSTSSSLGVASSEAQREYVDTWVLLQEVDEPASRRCTTGSVRWEGKGEFEGCDERVYAWVPWVRCHGDAVLASRLDRDSHTLYAHVGVIHDSTETQTTL
ncbi:hypothetical protein KQX54_007869 [Cotesia glomerata]|uniref:Uncharacterized protein n=1 Tax=Cotesia glomerata TaxID=32391 RepID=A0AAV7HY94_COTGL|nr:hypothetical protein KQX54_007869 [Cotesia glomerata]